MISNALVALLLIFWTIPIVAASGRRFEECLPMSCMGIVLAMFVFGLFGFLRLAPPFVALVACAGLCAGAVLAVRRGTRKDFLGRLLTPGFALTIAFWLALSYLDYGMVASVWDEFSHWADIVKVMTQLDDFGTNPLSHSRFQSYPPAMALYRFSPTAARS